MVFKTKIIDRVLIGPFISVLFCLINCIYWTYAYTEWLKFTLVFYTLSPHQNQLCFVLFVCLFVWFGFSATRVRERYIFNALSISFLFLSLSLSLFHHLNRLSEIRFDTIKKANINVNKRAINYLSDRPNYVDDDNDGYDDGRCALWIKTEILVLFI